MIRVFLPSQLDSYTGGLREVQLEPAQLSLSGEHLTLMDVIQALDKRFKGLAFRVVDEQQQIRRHIAMFVGEEMVRRLDIPLEENARVQIVGALSGG